MSIVVQTAAPPDLSVPVEPPSPEQVKKSPELALALADRAEGLRQVALTATNDAAQWREYAEGLKRRDVAVLGRDQVFVVRDGNQRARCVKVPVRLTLEEGHLYCVQGKWNITADGYVRLNQVAGLTTVQPDTIIVDGRERPNPYLEMHPQKPGVLLRVHCRVITIGRAVTGQPCAVDYRLKFDPNLYLIQSLKKAQAGTWDDKARKKVPAFKAIQDMTQSEWDEERAAGQRKGWAFLPFAAIGDDFIGLAFDLKDADVRAMMGDQVNLVNFAERRAQTIAWRNAVRKNPAIAVTTVHVVPDETRQDKHGNERIVRAHADVVIYGWPPDTSRTLKDVGDMIAAGTRGSATPQGSDVEVIEDEVDPDTEDADAAESTEDEVRERGDDAPVAEEAPHQDEQPAAASAPRTGAAGPLFDGGAK